MIDFPANPTVGQAFQVGNTIYKCVSIEPAVWSATVASGGIPDSPVDGKIYGRQSAAWAEITKAAVGLGNVDNTSDANKPISTATQTALNGKENSITVSTTANYWRGDKVWAALNPTAVGLGNVGNYAAVARTGDTMTGALTVPIVYTPSVTNTAARVLLQSDQTIDCVNVANNVWVPLQAGRLVAQNSGDAIRAPNGNISTDQLLYAGTPGVRTIGPVNANGRLDCATGMGMFYDGGNANFLMMGAGNGAAWTWQWTRNTGMLNWLGGSSQGLVSIDGGGQVISNYGAGGDSFYAQGNGGFRTNKAADTAFYAPSGGMTIGGTASVGGNVYTNCVFSRPGNGYQWNPGYADNGAGGSYCTICFGSPNYGNMAMRYWHQSGQYVGLTMDGENWTRWSLQSGRWIAAGYDLQSDLRGKTNLLAIPSARSKIAALTGYTYDCIDSHNYDGTPYRDVGIVAQELLAVLPEAVKEQLTPTYLNEDGTVDESRPAVMRYTISPMAVIATLVNDNNGLAARIADLEARLTALGG